MRRTSLILAAATLAAMACGGSSGGYTSGPTNPGTGTGAGTPPVATNTVTLTTDNQFTPGSIDVPAGTTVTWKWAPCTDGGYGGYGSCPSHSVAFDDGISSATQSDGTFSRTFTAAGTFKYHCAIHGSAMSGQVTVK